MCLCAHRISNTQQTSLLLFIIIITICSCACYTTNDSTSLSKTQPNRHTHFQLAAHCCCNRSTRARTRHRQFRKIKNQNQFFVSHLVVRERNKFEKRKKKKNKYSRQFVAGIRVCGASLNIFLGKEEILFYFNYVCLEYEEKRSSATLIHIPICMLITITNNSNRVFNIRSNT